EFAQVPQAVLERAQLGVVEAPGHLLAVARDEGHRRTVVQQGHGGADLFGADTEFVGDLVMKGHPVSHDTKLCLPPLAPMMALWPKHTPSTPDPAAGRSPTVSNARPRGRCCGRWG